MKLKLSHMEMKLARSIGFAEGKHEDLRNMTERGLSWQEFVLRGEMIRYARVHS
jgi:hypothetical protein